MVTAAICVLIAALALLVTASVFARARAQYARRAEREPLAERLLRRHLARRPRALLVVAHPDDECMFFGPGLLALGDGADVHVLCLSNGNADGIGAARAKEMEVACALLGVPPSHVAVLDDPALQDGLRQSWDEARAARIVGEHVARHGIDLVLTFDERGITGHPNHIATGRAARDAARAAGVPAWELVSVPVWRRYLSVAEAWACVLAPDATDATAATVFAPEAHFQRARAAAYAHATQMVWFRQLHITFASYMWINRLRRRP